MYYAGIDVAKKSHRAVILDGEGEKLGKSCSFDNSQEGMESLHHKLKQRDIAPQEILIGMEATGNFWENLYTFLTDKHYKVILLNPYQVSKFRQALMKKAKTDDIDALVIAGLLRSKEYRSSYIPSEQIEDLRELTKIRYEFMKDQKSYKRQAKALLHLIFPEYTKTFIQNPFTVSSTKVLTEYPTAKHLASAKQKKIEKMLRSIRGNNFTIKDIKHLLSVARESIYSGRCKEVRGMKLRMILTHVQKFEDSIAAIDKQIDDILSPSSDDSQLGGNLFSIPGVGPKTVAAFLSIAGENGSVFETATQITGHIGFFPQIFESGESKKENKISKRGPKYIRWALYIAAVSCVRNNRELGHLYHIKRSQGKSSKQALVYVAKKLSHIMLSMLKSGEEYRPERVFQPA